jgi:hypothetical protein
MTHTTRLTAKLAVAAGLIGSLAFSAATPSLAYHESQGDQKRQAWRAHQNGRADGVVHSRNPAYEVYLENTYLGGVGFRSNHFVGTFGNGRTAGDGCGGYSSRVCGLRGRFHECGRVWCHWGAYYGPMISIP